MSPSDLQRWLIAGAALVTGGSSGIGLAIARALKDEGFELTLASRTREKVEAAAEERMFSLRPADARSQRQIRAKVLTLEAQLQSWWQASMPSNAPPFVESLPEPAFDRAKRIKSHLNTTTTKVILGLLGITGVALWICKLLNFPFDLTRGDEGWAFLLITTAAAVFQSFPFLRGSK